MILIVALALIPVVLLGWWIYRKDSARPEPLRELVRAFLFGVGSTFVSLVISTVMNCVGLFVYDLGSFTGAISTALFAAAIPEECAKLLMLWLLLRRNKYYDEYFDGIVYAACIGLGFAGFENIFKFSQFSFHLINFYRVTAYSSYDNNMFPMKCRSGTFKCIEMSYNFSCSF